MPPTRGRLPQDDARIDIAATREKHTTTTSTVTKVRRNVAAVPMASMSSKDSGVAMNNSMAGGLSAPGISWSTEQVALLHAYRSAYGVDTPSAMKSPLNLAVLTAPGIGRRSPTMAKPKEKRKTGKEQVALAVRKHFNGLAVIETDVVVDFLYSVKFQDQYFKMRFAPPGSKT